MSGITLRDGKKQTNYSPGQHLHQGRIDWLEIDEHFEAVVHERPNVGGGAKTPCFQAGVYPLVHMGYGWMDKREGHLIEVRPTAISKNELIQIVWWKKRYNGKYGLQNQYLPPGTFDAQDGDFPNDKIENIVVPETGSVEVYEDSGQGRRHVRLGPGHHKLDQYNLRHEVSSIVFALDEWEEIGIEVGKPSNLEKVGETKIQNVDIKVPAGRSSVTANINTTRVRKVETSWEANSKITSNTKVTASAFNIVEVETSVETVLEAKAAGSEYNKDETGFGIEVQVEPDENDRVKGTLLVDVLKGKVPLVKVLRNERTNEEIRIRGETTGEILESRGNFVD